MKIGLISDVHASPEPLAEALSLLREAEVDDILCAGDIAGYGPDLAATVELLVAYRCRSILGNHDVWHLQKGRSTATGPPEAYLRALPWHLEYAAAGKTLYMVHASPPESLMDGIMLRDEQARLIPARTAYWTEILRSFPYDLLVVGHTHQVFAERLGEVLVVNPGSTRFNHTCMILHLPAGKTEILPLAGQEPVLAWNWGMEKAGSDELS